MLSEALMREILVLILPLILISVVKRVFMEETSFREWEICWARHEHRETSDRGNLFSELADVTKLCRLPSSQSSVRLAVRP